MSSKFSRNSHLLNILRPILALVFSVLIHFFLFNQLDKHYSIEPQFGDIDVELAAPLSKKVMVHKPSAKKQTLLKKTSTPPAQQPQDNNIKPLNEKEIKPIDSDASAPVVAETPMTDTAPETSSNESPITASEDAGPVMMSQPPTQIELAFDISRGNTKIGVAQVHFESSNGAYRLTSERKATGLAAAFVKAKDIEISEGQVTAAGLMPVKFSHQFGKDGRKIHYADFDWTSAKLNLHENETSTLVDLPQATQDMLSFMYQFMFVPPLAEMQITVTNGRKLSQYTYSFEGEETIETGQGSVKALHIAKNSDASEEKLELWLGTDYHHLPMKIRKTNKDGTVFEQTLTKLETKQ